MTIESTITSQTMQGDGLNRTWPFTFRAWEGELRVLISQDTTDQDVTADSDIVLNDGGGVITYPRLTSDPPLASGWRITIMREMEMTQETELVNAARFDPWVIEEQLDRLIANDQQLAEQVARCIQINPGNPNPPISAEDFYAEVAKLVSEGKDEVQAIADVARAYAYQAKAEADRAASLVDPAALSSRVYNVRRAWVLEGDIPAGGTLTMPGYYFPTRNILSLYYGGVVCTPLNAWSEMAGQYQYAEVGDDPNAVSNEVVLHFAAKAGDAFDMLVSASGISTQEFEDLVADASAASQAANRAKEDAEDAAARAEAAAVDFPDISGATSGQVATAVEIDGVMTAVWTSAPGGTRTKMKATLTADLPAGSELSVPSYVVGVDKLDIHLGGALCDPGDSAADGFYKENGDAGATSTTITIFEALPAGREITAIAAS